MMEAKQITQTKSGRSAELSDSEQNTFFLGRQNDVATCNARLLLDWQFAAQEWEI